MIPSASDLQYFIEVANTLNVSRAAERLGVSQPALSLAIQRLEGNFGVPLLIRSKSGVQLTKNGQKLLGQARALMMEWEKIRSEALQDESQISGRYTLGCHVSVALYSLPSFLPALVRDNARLEIKLVHDLSRKITEDVISFKVDFGIVVNPTPHPDLVIRTLGKDEVKFWIGKGSEKVQDPTSGEAVLICEPDLAQSQSLIKQAAKKGWKFKRTLTSSSLEVIRSMTSEGAGIGILPSRVATSLSLGLKPLKESPKFEDEVCLVYRADAQKSFTGKHLARLIAEKFNPEKF
jgi:LysR family transcriptional regulator, cell division regulator